MISKDILFYSNFCQHSKDVSSIITKKNIKDNFVFVCIDNTNLKLPHFVDRVPMICTTQRQVLSDDNLLRYLESIAEPALDNIEAGGDFYQNNSISDQYAFIKGDEYIDTGKNQNYVYVQEDHHIPFVSEDTRQQSKQSISLDSIIEMRNEEERKLKAMQKQQH